MTAALPEAVREAGRPVEIWFQDEARVGQQGTLAYVWAERGVGAALVLPHADADAMTLHLAEISRSVAPGAHAARTPYWS